MIRRGGPRSSQQPPTPPADAEERAAAPRGPVIAWAVAMLALVWLEVAPLTFVDPDVWHQMSLAREIWRTGEIPSQDVFAYTPTLRPLVHHEWGAGLLWLGIGSLLGGAGFLVFKYLLVAGVLALSVRAARRRGADAVTLVVCALPAILLVHYGFTTIRPQLLSLLALSLLMNVLAAEADGKPRWLAAWVFVHVIWLNVHAGFVVGLGFLGLMTLERAVRRERFAPLAVTTAAAAAFSLLNPWGADYLEYLAHALTMERPTVPEWAPLWVDLGRRWGDLLTWSAMIALTVYAVRDRGVRAAEGITLVGASALFALLHQRHVTLLAITWFAIAVPWLAETPLADRVRRLFAARGRLVVVIGALACAIWLTGGALSRPWKIRIPADAVSQAMGHPTYPIGAVDYLAEVGFQGNVMTPFVEGAYVMWRLHPQGVRVSYDGRYEAAYLPSVVRDHWTFYSGSRGWPAVLGRYPTDVALVPRRSPVLRPLLSSSGWQVVYGDDLYVLVARPGLDLPFVDHRSRVFHDSFP